jgi:hypothetical protein
MEIFAHVQVNLTLFMDMHLLIGLAIVFPLMEAIGFFIKGCAKARCFYIRFHCSGKGVLGLVVQIIL